MCYFNVLQLKAKMATVLFEDDENELSSFLTVGG